MISAADVLRVLTATVPLYVAMIAAYTSVRWLKLFTPEQCSGINRYVAMFAIPLLSFDMISRNNPYQMNARLVASDMLQKFVVLLALAAWVKLSSRGNFEWLVTGFSLSTLPNTLVVGIPLLKAMYGDSAVTLLVQIVVLQSMVWNTLLMLLMEIRAAKVAVANDEQSDTSVSPGTVQVDSEAQTPEITGEVDGQRVHNQTASMDTNATKSRQKSTGGIVLVVVMKKLLRNPNTYSSMFGLIWALISFRFNLAMPKVIEKSISILSDGGLGMAMFSLGLFMASQPKIAACGKRMTAIALAARFLAGPAVMALSAIAVGLRSSLLKFAIVQAALPQGIVPFVFAKEYNVKANILSTGVIVGMLIALPITLAYYTLLDL
ncbi:auxin efflux carrier component 1a [Nymphaea colorata]|nr:auxin efflux carrier component 1a [Nymphaea colorata]